VVLENAAEAGGLSRTIEIDGAVFDLGGHSFHTPHARVRELVFGALEMYEQKREARCWCAGRLIDYPFQSHFDQLDDGSVVSACAGGLAEAGDGGDAADFDTYLRRRFGDGIARHFLLPYNRKLWGRDLRRLGTGWTRERVAAASVSRIDGPEGQRLPLREDTLVAYPARGGFGEICRALARHVPALRFGQAVQAIDPDRRVVTTASGARFGYRHLVSTLPLPDLAAALPSRPPWMEAELAALEAVGLVFVFLVLEGRVNTDIQRIYCGDPACPVHKFVINHTSSPSLRERPRHGILAEVSVGEAAGRADLEACVVEALVRMRVIGSPGDVRTARTTPVRRAYPAPTHGRDAAVRRVTSWLAERNIHSIGRFGEWAYINSDEALHRGLVLGDRLRAA
jgi:UDP-galactopyranose mutase